MGRPKLIEYTDKIEYKHLYNVWIHLKGRCIDPNNWQYKNYGGRGIKVSEKWLLSFKNFYIDMQPIYVKGLTLDRIDNDKGYYPNNCQWVSSKVNNNNRRDNVWVEHDGMKKTLKQWSEFAGLKPSTFYQRYYVYKWDFKRCLSPVKKGAQVG